MEKLSVQDYKEFDINLVKLLGPMREYGPVAPEYPFTKEKSQAIFKIIKSGMDLFFAENEIAKNLEVKVIVEEKSEFPIINDQTKKVFEMIRGGMDMFFAERGTFDKC